MATRTAQSSGNWADIWDTIPGDGDTIDLAGYTVTIPNGYTTAVIAGGAAGTSFSVGASGSTLDIKNGGTLRYSGILRFNSGCVLKTQGGATLEASPAIDGGNAYVYLANGSILDVYDTSAGSPVIWTRSGANKSYYTFLALTPIALDYAEISTGGQCYFAQSSSLSHLDVFDGSYLNLQSGNHIVQSCIFRGSAAYGISVNNANVRMNNVIFGRDADENDDPHGTAAIFFNGARIFSGRIANYSPALFAWGGGAPLPSMLDILDSGYVTDDGFLPAIGSRGSALSVTYFGTAGFTLAAGKYSLTPSSNAGEVTPLRWPDRYLPGLLSAPIPAAAGQAVALSFPVTLNASQTADSVRLVLDPDNMYGCYAVSAQATPSDATTELTASGTVAAGVSNVLIPWRIEINAYAAGGVVDVESAAATVDGVVHTLDQRSMRWIAPAATGGRRRCDFAGVRFAT